MNYFLRKLLNNVGASSYPGGLDSFTTKTDKVDDNAAADMNEVQNSVVAIETELGTDVAGDQTDLKTRLGICIADDGAMKNGSSFPGSPSDGDFFYRTDENVMYIYNGSGWDSQGQSLSNVIYCWTGTDDFADNSYGIYNGTDQSPNALTGTYTFLFVENTTARTVLRSKWTKIAGVSSVTIHARLWIDDGSSAGTLTADIGGANNSVTSVGTTTPTWAATPTVIDVSGLSDGTVYDVAIKMTAADTTNNIYCSSVILIGS